MSSMPQTKTHKIVEIDGGKFVSKTKLNELDANIDPRGGHCRKNQ